MSDSFSYLSSADLTDVGRRRKNNEDSLIRLPESGVFAVADGMGGVQGGEVASKAVVDALREAFTVSPDAAFAVTAASAACLVARALDHASQWIKARSDERGTVGTGSTAVVLVFDRVAPSRALILHAGDSRAYRYRADRLVQLSADHSVAAAAGLPDDKNLPAMFRGVITRAVGLESRVQLERTATDVQPGDLFLLCSDGLNKMVSDKLLHKLLKKHRNDSLEETVRVLIDEALKAGGEDNVSALLVRVGDRLPEAGAQAIPPQTLKLEQEAAAAEEPATVPPAAGDEQETGQTADTGRTVDSAKFEGEGVTPPELARATPQTPPTPASGAGVTPDVPAGAAAGQVEKRTRTVLQPAPPAKPARSGWLLAVLLVLAAAGAAAAWFYWGRK